MLDYFNLFSFIYVYTYICFVITEKLAEAIRKFSSLKNELIIPKGPPGKKADSRSSGPVYPLSERPHIPARKLHDLKLAFTEFYLSLVLLQNYQSLNFTGFRKILKKHDKVNINMQYEQMMSSTFFQSSLKRDT